MFQRYQNLAFCVGVKCFGFLFRFFVVTLVSGQGTSINPTLIVTQNENTYRCNKRTKSDKTKKGIFMFACSKRVRQNCPFRFQAKMIFTDDPKKSEFWIKENWKILEIFENHTCDETGKERDRIKLERTRLKNEIIKKLERNERIQNTEFPTIVSVLRHAPTSKSPILLLKQNGKNYRCRKAAQTPNHMTFICSKREWSGCSFRMFAKMLITKDPSNENFWSVENWKISELFVLHTCSEE